MIDYDVTRHFLYVLRWAVLAVPGAMLLDMTLKRFPKGNIYLIMVLTQVLLGALIFFIDSLIFSLR